MHEGGTDRYWNIFRFSEYFSRVGHDFGTKLGAFWNFLSFIVRSYMYAVFSSGPRQQVKGAVVLWNQGVGVVMAAFRVFIWQIFAPQNTKTVFLTSSKYLNFSIPQFSKSLDFLNSSQYTLSLNLLRNASTIIKPQIPKFKSIKFLKPRNIYEIFSDGSFDSPSYHSTLYT